jgi:hypothetical protein
MSEFVCNDALPPLTFYCQFQYRLYMAYRNRRSRSPYCRGRRLVRFSTPRRFVIGAGSPSSPVGPVIVPPRSSSPPRESSLTQVLNWRPNRTPSPSREQFDPKSATVAFEDRRTKRFSVKPLRRHEKRHTWVRPRADSTRLPNIEGRRESSVPKIVIYKPDSSGSSQYSNTTTNPHTKTSHSAGSDMSSHSPDLLQAPSELDLSFRHRR